MITTGIIEAHLAGTVLPQPDLRMRTSGTSKVMTTEDKAVIDKQQTTTRNFRLPTPATATTSKQDGRLNLPVYLAHLETQQTTIERFCGTCVKDALRVVEDEPKKHSRTIPLPYRERM